MHVKNGTFTPNDGYYKNVCTYPLTKPLRLLIGDAVVAAEFSVDNVRSKETRKKRKKRRQTWNN